MKVLCLLVPAKRISRECTDLLRELTLVEFILMGEVVKSSYLKNDQRKGGHSLVYDKVPLLFSLGRSRR